jgi:multiple sugar transport system permease protein
VRETTRRNDNLTALPLVAPFVIVYAALFVWPTLQMLATSFTNGGLVTSGKWVGLANYARLIDDHKFWGAVGHTLYFVLMTVLPSTLLGLAFALLVNRLKGALQAAVLAAFFLPYILPVTTVSSIAWALSSPGFGPFGNLAHSVSGNAVPVWRDLSLALPGVAVVTVWWTIGFNVLMFVAGLRALPHELFEAARLDGANRFTIFTHVTWPLIWPVMALVLTIQLILQLKVFDQVFLILGNGQSNSTMVLVQYIYVSAFTGNQAGYGDAIAVALFVLVLVVSVVQFQILRLRGAR